MNVRGIETMGGYPAVVLIIWTFIAIVALVTIISIVTLVAIVSIIALVGARAKVSRIHALVVAIATLGSLIVALHWRTLVFIVVAVAAR